MIIETHEDHLEQDRVIENATHAPLDYLCCVDEFDEMVRKGEACREHPFKFCEPGYCEGCAESSQPGISYGVVGNQDY